MKRLRLRRWAWLAALGTAFVAAVPAVSAAPARETGSVRVLVIKGHGYGHGVGLSQWGAHERAVAGQSYEQILGFYYPGSRVGAVADRPVRVLIAEQSRLLVGSSSPFVVRDGNGRSQRLSGGRHELTADGLDRARVDFPLFIRPGAAPLQVGDTRYRGELVIRRRDQVLEAINVLPLEQYVVGVVSSEMPGYWPQQALRAQAVASRTYALASLQPGRSFDLYPDDRSQNYHGLKKEFASGIAAVAATRQQALLYGGRPIEAFFSASNGGLTSGPDGAWGGTRLPYLVSRADDYDARSPVRNWGPLRVPIDTLRVAFPELPANVSTVEVVQSDAGRAMSVAFVAADGASYEVAGPAFQERLQLRSTYLSIAPIRE